MCLYPKLIKNRKYIPNKKNGWQPPPVLDIRTELVPVGCGNCIECRKQKAREWQVRLQEDIKTNTNGKFITLTFNNESITKIHNIVIANTNKEIERLNKLPKTTEILKRIDRQYNLQEGYNHDNEIATVAVRLFLERWRKEYKKSLRHWLVTELGHHGTENIHLHGIIWTDKIEEIERKWEYGYIWKGKKTANGIENYVNAKTVNYIVKYMNKIDEKHPNYKGKMLTSAGIGKNYTNTTNALKNKFQENTLETYRTSTGHKISLPIYYRNKIYTEEQREQLWIQKLNKQERWILGRKISIKESEDEYFKALKHAQQENKELGYGDDKKNWEQIEYEKNRRKFQLNRRIKPPAGGCFAGPGGTPEG